MAEPDPERRAPDQPAAPSSGDRRADDASSLTQRDRDAYARAFGDAEPEDEAAASATTASDDRRDAAADEHRAPARSAASSSSEDAQVRRPAEPQAVMEPAQAGAPQAPKRRSNRLAGTAWVLLAAGLFQVVYFAAVAALVALLGGPEVVGPQLAQYASTPFAWLPVLFFFLLFELTVLIFNRAGRFLYVVASLVVGVLVYVISVLLVTILVRGDVGDRATLEQSFLSPLFVLAGLAAREVMLWTGVAIGARGTRLRKRNRADRDSYRAELEEREHAA